VEGLKRKLTNNMAPEAASLRPAWDVGECIATFWRPNFDVSLYPYLPAHITRPKEVKKLFLITMPEHCYLAVRSALLQCSPFASARATRGLISPSTSERQPIFSCWVSSCGQCRLYE
jgi:hypothetical protein